LPVGRETARVGKRHKKKRGPKGHSPPEGVGDEPPEPGLVRGVRGRTKESNSPRKRKGQLQITGEKSSKDLTPRFENKKERRESAPLEKSFEGQSSNLRLKKEMGGGGFAKPEKHKLTLVHQQKGGGKLQERFPWWLGEYGPKGPKNRKMRKTKTNREK